MKFLHTSDWHVGKVLRGHNRLAEQQAILAEIVDLARAHAVDAVLIAGDLYETSTPSAQAQALVVATLTALRATGAEVIAIAGNHDHAPTFEAYRPLLHQVGITLAGDIRPADDGGIVSFTARSTGERVNVALVPFLNQRYAVRAAELLTRTPADNAAGYDQMVRDILASLTAAFTPNAVNIVMAHLTVAGSLIGAGGERTAQTIYEYYVPASAFGVTPHYVALGHLHRRQSLPAGCPVQYCGAPFAVDFGEQDNTNVVLLVEATPTTPATVTELPITAGRRLRTVTGTVAQLTARAGEFGEDFLRVIVREPHRAGLPEEIRRVLRNVLLITIDPEFVPVATRGASAGAQLARSPADLVATYCAERGVDDPRVTALFARLHDQLTDTSRTMDPDGPAAVDAAAGQAAG
jgi:exonuclease SbcD